MSTFTSNLTETMSAVYLSSSVGPMAFGEMSSTYFVIEFCQFLNMHQPASSGNPEVSTFLSGLDIMQFQLPFNLFDPADNTTDNTTNTTTNNTVSSRRLMVSTAAKTVSKSFLIANQSIILLMLIFLAIYITTLLMQKYMDCCFKTCPNARFYSTEICEFLLKRFKWAYFDFILWLSYMPFLFFALVQLQMLSVETADKAISSVLSVVIILTYPLYPFFIGWLIKSHYAVLQVEDSDALLEMSMSPYVGKIKRDKWSLLYYPLKYLRKLLFIIFVSLISDGITVLSLLMSLNILFIVYLCAKRPHSSKLFFGFDLSI